MFPLNRVIEELHKLVPDVEKVKSQIEKIKPSYPRSEKLFNSKFNHRIWRKICKNAGLNDLKFHDLRKIFCSLLAQNGVSTTVTQRLLEHSSPHLTNKVYTNVDPVLRQSVNQLPIAQWLQK